MAIEESTIDVCIFLDVIWVFTIPLYIYAFIKWQQFRQHFLIRKRFPIFTYCLAAAAILEHLFSTILCWSLDRFLISSIPALMFAALSSILYRTYLIYIRWKQLQHAVNENNTPTPISPLPSIPKSSYCFILYILMGTILVFLEGVIWIGFAYFAWISVGIIGFVIIFVFKYNKIAEGIGISLETVLTESIIVFTLILSQFASFHPIFAQIMRYLYEISTLLWSLMPLYLTIFNIYRAEGTLNVKCITNKRQSSLINDITTTLSGVDINGNPKKPELNFDQPFIDFLEKERNYQIYAQYLVYVFAIENLFFLERVSIFLEIVYSLNINNGDNKNMNRESITINEIKDVCLPEAVTMRVPSLSLSDSTIIGCIPRIKFVFLQSIHEEYMQLIEETCNGDDGVNGDQKSFEHYKPGFNLIIKKICDEFVKAGAVQQVNISSKTREKIMSLIMDEKHFEEYEHYIHLFDQAMREILKLNIALYKYKFRMYAQQRQSDETKPK